MTRMSLEERVDELSYQSDAVRGELITIAKKVEEKIREYEELDLMTEQKRKLLHDYLLLVKDIRDIADTMNIQSSKLFDMLTELSELDKRL